MVTQKDIERYKKQLEAMGQRVRGNVGLVREDAMRQTGAEPSGGLSNAPLHPADLANRQFEEEVSLGLVQNEEHLLEEIGAALERIEKKEFGRCENCKRAITKERLNAIPYARLCVACARQHEGNAS